MIKSIIAVSAVGLAAVAADTCDPSELAKFTPVLSDPNLSSCQEAGSFDLMGSAIRRSSQKDVWRRCLYKTVQGLGPKDCDIEVAGMKFNIASWGKTFQSICGNGGGSSSPSPSSGSNGGNSPSPS